MLTFLPHGVLLAIGYLWWSGVFVPGSATIALTAALVLPVWVIALHRESLSRAALLGPGVAIGGGIAVLFWLWGNPVGGVMALLLAVVLALYAIYCALVFAVAGRLLRRKKGSAPPARDAQVRDRP